MELTALERAVIEATLAGEHPLLVVLRRQWATARATDRQNTGVGLYLSIEVAPDAAKVPFTRLLFGDVIIDLPDKEDAMGSLLVIENGRLACVEIFTFDMPWPEDVSGFALKYTSEPRSFAALDSAVRG